MTINEVKTAWNNRFKNLDKILSYNYNSMKSGDQKLKDAIFHAYYRYYNDGDVNAFRANLLKRIGASPETIKAVDASNRSDVKMMKKYGSSKNHSILKNYEKAMEDVILQTFKYFKKKYPDFFNAKGRQKAIDKWKREIIKYATDDVTELDTYWVGEFGKQFGITKLAKFGEDRHKTKKYKITNPDTIAKVIKIMMTKLKIKSK